MSHSAEATMMANGRRRVLGVLLAFGGYLACLPAAGAVDPNFYKYSVRHEKGAPPFFPMTKVENELVNSANGNLFFTIPLLTRPGRNGLGVNLALAYNSKIWDHYVSGGTLYATLAERDSWVGAGWTLLIARVIQAGGQYFVTLSDGSNHELFDYGGGIWRSRDSSYMIYKPAENKLTLTGSLTLIFGYVDYLDPTIRYATRVYDNNRNYIDITYNTGSSGAGGRISKIEDTLGNTFTFGLDANNRLASARFVDVNGHTRSISFSYESRTPGNFYFGEEPTDPSLPTQYVLTTLDFVGNGFYGFTYNSYNSLEIQEIHYPTCGRSRYFYATREVFDRPLNRTVFENMVGSHDGGLGSNWYWTLGTSATQTAPSSVTVSAPGVTWVHEMWIGGAGWSDGFSKILRETSGSQNVSETRRYWTQDNELDPNILNPRLLRNERGLKPQGAGADQVITTGYVYAPATDFSGNVKEIWEYGYGQYGTPGALRRKTLLAYLHETNSAYRPLNILDRVTSTLVYDGNNALIAKTETVYDQLALLSSPTNATRHDPLYGLTYTTRGLPNVVTKWYDNANNLYVSTSTQYDEFGNPRIVTDGRNYSTTIDYGASGSYAFPLQVTNPKGHVTRATYNYAGGVVLTQTDANQKVTTYAYDPWFRVQLVTKPDGGTTTYSYYSSTCSLTPPRPAYADVVEAVNSTSSRTRRANLDDMGRLQEARASDPIGGAICQTRQYNALSQLSSSSLPFRDGQTSYANTYSYGGSRPSSVTLAAGGTIQYSYDLNTTTVTNTDGKQRKYSYQEDGKISQVLEEDSGGGLTVATNYAYDKLGRLLTITQGSQTRTFTYDALGRLKTEKHPESSAAGNSYSYTYDANSNLVTKTDARGITTTLVYDELNRVTSKTHSNGTPAVTYFYDSQPAGSPIAIQNAIGRLTKVTTTTGGVTATNYYSYCNCSAVDREATVIQDGTTKTYITSYTYNYVGGITSITYPSGKTVNYTHDSLGRKTRVWSPLDWRSIDYVRSASYLGPQGGLTQIEYGIRNGTTVYLTTNITYSPTTMRMTTLQTHGVYLSYKYDVPGMTGKQTGHIYDIDDLYGSTGDNNTHYEYDRWYRLTRWWRWPTREGAPSAATWTYDNYGNITSLYWSFPTNYFDVNPLTNRLQGTGYVYDAAGNMTGAPGGVTRTFDAENRMTSTSQGGLSFLYDGSGRRLRKMAGTTKIYFVYSSTGRLLVEDNWTASTTKDHVYFNGQLIATRDQAGYVRVLFKDHLGSTRSVVKVDPPGDGQLWGLDWTTVEVHDYRPYGVAWSSYWDDSEQTSQRFTGQKRDSESGLDYFGARYYDFGSVGGQPRGNPRWISPDPGPLVLEQPASLNRYAYTVGDPVNYIDVGGSIVVCFRIAQGGFDWFDSFGFTRRGRFCFLVPPPVPPWQSEFRYCGGGEQGFRIYREEIRQITFNLRFARGRAAEGQCNRFLNYLIERLRERRLLTDENLTPQGLLSGLRPLDPLHPCADEDGPAFPGNAKTFKVGNGYEIWLKHAAFLGASLYATIIHEAFHVATDVNDQTHNVIKQALLDAPRWVRRPRGSIITPGPESGVITDFIEVNCGPSS